MVQTIIFKLFDQKLDYKYIFSKQHFLQSFTDFIIYFFLVLFQNELLGQPIKIILKTDAITTSPFTRLESSFHMSETETESSEEEHPYANVEKPEKADAINTHSHVTF